MPQGTRSNAFQVHKTCGLVEQTPSSPLWKVQSWSSVPWLGQKPQCYFWKGLTVNKILLSTLWNRLSQGGWGVWSPIIETPFGSPSWKEGPPTWSPSAEALSLTTTLYCRGVSARCAPQHLDTSYPLLVPCHWGASKLLQWLQRQVQLQVTEEPTSESSASASSMCHCQWHSGFSFHCPIISPVEVNSSLPPV